MKSEYLSMLGCHVTDKVTNLRGVVVSLSFDLSGCIQALVHPGLDEKGILRETVWIDVARLVIGIEPQVMRPPIFGFDVKADLGEPVVPRGPMEKFSKS